MHIVSWSGLVQTLLLITKEISPLTDSHKTEQKTEKLIIFIYNILCGWQSNSENVNLLLINHCVIDTITVHETVTNVFSWTSYEPN